MGERKGLGERKGERESGDIAGARVWCERTHSRIFQGRRGSCINMGTLRAHF
jgi:hypothetical protein